jgi:DNA (cytosine-5)-methyltransferase 1
MSAIPVIDLFAGPGGLGEGFSSLTDANNERIFKIKLSIEMDEQAHQTLELRAFFREFPVGEAPQDYYDYLARKISREELFKRHPQQAENARQEAWLAELGGKDTPKKIVHKRIRAALGESDDWVLIGGPPCQAYSLVGRSRVIGGKGGLEQYEADPRHKLYRHYLRILAVHQPSVFVMENVKGLLSAKVKQKHIFERILADLENPTKALPWMRNLQPISYKLYPLSTESGDLAGEFKPEDFVLRAEDHGVPQARHRIIIIGVRSNIRKRPGVLAKADPVTVAEVIGDLPRLRSGLSKEPDSAEAWRKAVREIGKAGWLRNSKLKKILAAALCHVGANLPRGAEFLPGATIPVKHAEWFFDKLLDGILNHETRGHIRKDLHRYFFASVFTREHGRSSLLEDLPPSLLPNHKNVEAALKETKFNDRFRVQVANKPSTTVVSHISKDGHYFIHYDPSQCRSLTVREAARLQTFPDNYFFEGPRTEQYKQVGNAVPPLLANQIAKIVKALII